MEFKNDYLQVFEQKVKGGTLNRRRSKTVNRENVLLSLVHEFSDSDQQNDLNFTVNFAFKLGRVNPSANLISETEIEK